MSPRRKLVLLAAVAIVVLFIVLTLAQHWGKATAERDVKRAEDAAKACIANPRAAAAQCTFAAKQLSEALPTIELTKKPELLEQTQKTLAQIYMATGKFLEAADLYVKLAATTPQQSTPYRDVATAYSMAGKHRAAERYSRLAIQLAPDDWRAYVAHSRILMRANQPEQALAALEQALAFAPVGEQTAIRQTMERTRGQRPEHNFRMESE